MTDRRSSEHVCHATGCSTRVPPRMFMCKPHWYALPKAYRDAVWDVYVPGQEQRMDPTGEYLTVARMCIRYLEARAEGLGPVAARRLAEGDEDPQLALELNPQETV